MAKTHCAVKTGFACKIWSPDKTESQDPLTARLLVKLKEVGGLKPTPPTVVVTIVRLTVLDRELLPSKTTMIDTRSQVQDLKGSPWRVVDL